MLLSKLHVKNYRGLRDVEIPLSRFGCLIGENNAGKSSTLQALSLLRSGATLSGINFFDDSHDVRIALTLTDIVDNDLARLAEEHRTKMKALLRSDSITLVRIYGTDGTSKLKYAAMMPKEERFSSANLDSLVKGKKAGTAFAAEVVAVFPELSEAVTAKMNQGDVRMAIQSFADSLPDDQKQQADVTLPTGIDESVVALLPEILYIPAVKDLADEVKTAQTTPFGKILGILLKVIEPKLADAKELFERLNEKMNRVRGTDGSIQDNRLDEVKLIESTVDKFVRESFSSVKIEIDIPPPELKTVLSGAKIFADDGVRGPIETKGDGLRRAIVFSILRSFVELQRSGTLSAGEADTVTADRYMLLFEEPELYLHPKAQDILFQALSLFARQHHVLVTTHSPTFFGPEATATFVKLRKVFEPLVAPKPFTQAYPIDLRDIGAKDQFQIICYENNNIAFFADTVVLVEGDSDYLVLPHLARVLNPDWDCGKTSVRFAKINGKTSIRRYKEFFTRSDARVMVLADLDLLIRSFDQIDPPAEIVALRGNLITAIDGALNIASPSDTSTGVLRDAHGSGDLKALWRRAKQAYSEYKTGRGTMDAMESSVDEFFAWERDDVKLETLKTPCDDNVRAQKTALLRALRALDIFVLERGAIEAYYPPSISGRDKPSKAQGFCNTVSTREAVLALCDEIEVDSTGQKVPEFEVIFSGIFREPV